MEVARAAAMNAAALVVSVVTAWAAGEIAARPLAGTLTGRGGEPIVNGRCGNSWCRGHVHRIHGFHRDAGIRFGRVESSRKESSRMAQVCPRCSAPISEDLTRCPECNADLDPCRTIPPARPRPGAPAK